MESIEQKNFFLKFVDNVIIDDFSISAARNTSMQIADDVNYHLVLFPGGLVEIAEYYEKFSLLKLTKQIEEDVAIQGVTRRIDRALVYKIIQSQFPKEFLVKIYKFYMKPRHAAISIKAAWSLCDMIWNLSGDQSTDYNYYTKRGLLFSVYNASMLYYLKDNSEGHQRTQEFITKSLTKVVKIGKVKSKIKSYIPNIENIPILRMFW